MTAVDLGVPQIGPGERIGAGGFGTVYRAEQLGLARSVAVKILSAVVDQDVELRRFERERQSHAAVADHPNIVSLFGWGLTAECRPYLIMEYLPGGTLADLIAAGSVAPPAAVSVTVKLARALAAAHSRGVLHRDVKPENVMISAFGEPVLCDFGIARDAGGASTHTTSVATSVSHAAPEVLEGHPPSEAGDVWALMSTLHTMLAGRPPFSGDAGKDSMAALITRVLTQPPHDLRPLGVPDDLADVVEGGLTKEPTMRLATASLVAERLEQVMAAHGWTHSPLPVEPTPPRPFPQPEDQTGTAAAPAVGGTVVLQPTPPVPEPITISPVGAAGTPDPVGRRGPSPLVLAAAGALGAALLAGIVLVAIVVTGGNGPPTQVASATTLPPETTTTTATPTTAALETTATTAMPMASTMATSAPVSVAPPATTIPAAVTASYCVTRVLSNDVLYVRSQPRASAGAVGSIPYDACGVARVGGTRQVGSSVWWEVSFAHSDGTVIQGWSNSQFLRAG